MYFHPYVLTLKSNKWILQQMTAPISFKSTFSNDSSVRLLRVKFDLPTCISQTIMYEEGYEYNQLVPSHYKTQRNVRTNLSPNH